MRKIIWLSLLTFFTSACAFAGWATQLENAYRIPFMLTMLPVVVLAFFTYHAVQCYTEDASRHGSADNGDPTQRDVTVRYDCGDEPQDHKAG